MTCMLGEYLGIFNDETQAALVANTKMIELGLTKKLNIIVNDKTGP